MAKQPLYPVPIVPYGQAPDSATVYGNLPQGKTPQQAAEEALQKLKPGERIGGTSFFSPNVQQTDEQNAYIKTLNDAMQQSVNEEAAVIDEFNDVGRFNRYDSNLDPYGDMPKYTPSSMGSSYIGAPSRKSEAEFIPYQEPEYMSGSFSAGKANPPKGGAGNQKGTKPFRQYIDKDGNIRLGFYDQHTYEPDKTFNSNNTYRDIATNTKQWLNGTFDVNKFSSQYNYNGGQGIYGAENLLSEDDTAVTRSNGYLKKDANGKIAVDFDRAYLKQGNFFAHTVTVQGLDGKLHYIPAWVENAVAGSYGDDPDQRGIRRSDTAKSNALSNFQHSDPATQSNIRGGTVVSISPKMVPGAANTIDLAINKKFRDAGIMSSRADFKDKMKDYLDISMHAGYDSPALDTTMDAMRAWIVNWLLSNKNVSN